MFSNLRVNNQFFVLHKDSQPMLEVGSVVSVTAPMPQFGTQLGQALQYYVDVVARVGDKNVTYQRLPANADVADNAGNGNIVVAASREAMSNEVAALKRRSADILASIDYHNSVITACEQVERQLNPEQAQQAAQAQEIADMRMQMSAMQQQLTQQAEINRQLLEQLKGEKTKTKKE